MSPRVYALTCGMPMSSPKITRMLGFWFAMIESLSAKLGSDYVSAMDLRRLAVGPSQQASPPDTCMGPWAHGSAHFRASIMGPFLPLTSSAPTMASERDPVTGTPNVLPRPDFHFTGEIGRTYLDSDPAKFPKPVEAPRGAPNIVLILI